MTEHLNVYIFGFMDEFFNSKHLLLFHFCRYVHNNIFFSFAVDADIEQLSKKRPSNQVTEKVSSSEKVSCTDATCENEEHNSCNEAPLVENEQATYASANNDLKGTKLYQEADVPGLYNLAMAIIDYRGHRVVAQVCSKTGTAKSLFLRICVLLVCIIIVSLQCVLECSTGNPSRG